METDAAQQEPGPPQNQAIARGATQQEEAGEGAVPYARTTFGIPLYTYHEIPSFLKGNPDIKEGYRAGLPAAMCLRR